jgi:hypothetical protein
MQVDELHVQDHDLLLAEHGPRLRLPTPDQRAKAFREEFASERLPDIRARTPWRDSSSGTEPVSISTLLDDEAVARTDGLEQREDARRAVFSMEGEPLVMDQRQIGAVVRSTLGSHRHMVPHAHLGGRRRSGGRTARAGTSHLDSEP